MRVPLFPLPIVVFPNENEPLHIFEERYKKLVAYCLDRKEPFAICAFIDNKLMNVGTMCTIKNVYQTYNDGKLDIGIKGFQRVRIGKIYEEESYLEADVDPINDIDITSDAALARVVQEKFIELINIAQEQVDHEIGDIPETSFEYSRLAGLSMQQKQELLELRAENFRLEFLNRHFDDILPRIRSFEQLKEVIKQNGHFRTFPPINLS